VLLKRWDERGVVFGTNYQSKKGNDLAANARAAGTLYWREVSRQINLTGQIERTAPQESDALFDVRSRASRAAAIVSRQSRSLDQYERFLAEVAALIASDDPLRRPPHWGGYRLIPQTIEFWQGSRDRLHRRLRYGKDGDGWRAVRLQP
jgi:pyridoxamine-phosphate oxidase